MPRETDHKPGEFTMRFTEFTLSTDATPGSKQEAHDHLKQLMEQLPDGYIRDILTTEAGDICRAIDDDVCFIDYRAQITAQQEHRAELARINQQIDAARKELAAKQREVQKELNRLDEIEQTRRELRNLLKAV